VNPTKPALDESDEECEFPSGSGKTLFLLSLAAVIGGLLVGFIGAIFRACLVAADHYRTTWIEWAQQYPAFGWLLPIVGAGIGAALAKLLVRFAPVAAGSGVQHVEAVMRGEATRAPLRVIPIKFFGGILSIGSGLALGREGPTVQMGATIGAEIADRFRMAAADLKAMQASLAGAGLAVAFNAPVGGATFVFEEVSHSFKHRLMLPTLIGCCMAICVSRAMLGDHVDFQVATLEHATWESVLPFLLFGGLLGVLGVWYNKATILAIEWFAKFPNIPMEIRAAIVGGLVGVCGWFAPDLIGGGETLNQQVLNGAFPLGMLVIVFAVRWVLGPLSYSAGTPGGLFAPLLLVGAAFGGLFGGVMEMTGATVWESSSLAFAIVGMSAFFTAVVRAPLTGIVLIAEMTATTALLIPMLAANFAALLITIAMKAPPIYDTLRARMLADPKMTVCIRPESSGNEGKRNGVE